MLGKCMWKLHNNRDRQEGRGPSANQIEKAYLNSIKVSPGRKEAKGQEPIFEPIYKLIILAHKLVQRGELDVGISQQLYPDTTNNSRATPDRQ